MAEKIDDLLNELYQPPKSFSSKAKDFLKDYFHPIQIVGAAAIGALAYGIGYASSLYTDFFGYLYNYAIQVPESILNFFGVHFFESNNAVYTVNQSVVIAQEVGKRSVALPASIGYILIRKSRRAISSWFKKKVR